MSHPPLCQGPPRPPPRHFLPSWGCSVPIRPRGSTLPDAQRGPFCHREHRGSGLSPWKAGPQRPWPRRRNAWLGSSPMSMALVLGIQRAARKRSLRGGESGRARGAPWGLCSPAGPLPRPRALLCLAGLWRLIAARDRFVHGAGSSTAASLHAEAAGLSPLVHRALREWWSHT